MSELSEKLLPCPCCGAEAHFGEVPVSLSETEAQSENAGGEYIECSKCSLCTALMFPLKEDIKRQLAERWNLRALSQPPDSDALCRTDGRCQYAIDHDAEGLGHCPEGKCCMPRTDSDAVRLLRSMRKFIYQCSIRPMSPIGYEEALAQLDAHLARQPAAQPERRRIEQLEAQNEAMVRLLSTLGVLAQPENIRLPDGRVMEFMPPAEKVQEYWRELSKVLRKLMTDLPAAREPEGPDCGCPEGKCWARRASEAAALDAGRLRELLQEARTEVYNKYVQNPELIARIDAALRRSAP